MPGEAGQTTDPDGRSVVLDERTRGHLSRRRPQMLKHTAAILDTVSRPDVREDDPASGRERLYRRAALGLVSDGDFRELRNDLGM